MQTKPTWVLRFEWEQRVRNFMMQCGYLEVRTPLLVRSPGMEPHIFPIGVSASSGPDQHPVFLPTSPEFGMKKLLAKGATKIFQFAPSFRIEPKSPEHRVEFTMLEWYSAECKLSDLQDEVEALLKAAGPLTYQENMIKTEGPRPRFQVNQLFQDLAGIDLRTHETKSELERAATHLSIRCSDTDTWNDIYFRIWLNRIEPKLPKDEVYFVENYPISQSSLCENVTDETGYFWADRFECYAGPIELANAFSELRDPIVQHKNFLRDQEERTAAYGSARPTSPIDPDLITSIAQMKPTVGIALGLDRLAMLALGAKDISEVIGIEPFWG
jgi:elongation factor P--(R)-beta-lysine ligase